MSTLMLPSGEAFPTIESLQTLTVPKNVTGISFTDAVSNIAKSVTDAAKIYYTTQGDVAVAKNTAAARDYATQTVAQNAKSGTVPSNNLLLIGGLGLLGLMVLTRK